MLILGIETSCDETSAAVVRDGRQVLSNIVSSQISLHAPYGGVVPEIASRRHVEVIDAVVQAALDAAAVEQTEIDVIAATYGPGLAGALLVGLSFARGLAWGLNLPLVPVNHLEGHLHSVWLDTGPDSPPPALPMLALIVSGGHTELVLMHDHGKYDVVGATLDDAAGEAFDKVARLLGLPYPGGPAIQACAEGADAPVQLPRARLPGTYDFSFSGLKTAVLHTVYETVTGGSRSEVRGMPLPRIDVAGSLADMQRANIAAGFQASVVDVLVSKTMSAAGDLGARSIAVVGGVAANRALRQQMAASAGVPLYIAPLKYSTDNAAMIAAAAHFVPRQDDGVDVRPNLGLAEAG